MINDIDLTLREGETAGDLDTSLGRGWSCWVRGGRTVRVTASKAGHVIPVIRLGYTEGAV